MRHLLAVLGMTVLGVGCASALLPGSGGTSASLGTPSPAVPSAGSPADAFTAPTTVPNQVKRIVYARDKVLESIAELEKGAANGQLDDDHFHHARVYFTIEYYESLIAGGVPACDVCKNNPTWKELKDEFPKISARYVALEKKYFKCDYGFMMAPDKYLPLSADWSVDDYKQLIAKAKPAGQGQKNHCWKSPKDYDWTY
jgi:hypothetical protein